MKIYIYILFIFTQSICANAFMTNTIAKGCCGDNITWNLSVDSILYISGVGKMEDYSDNSLAPWQQYNGKIKRIVIEEGITNIGKYAFMNCNFVEEIELPEGISTIGIWAFYKCYALKHISIPASVNKIESPAFLFCYNLSTIDVSRYNKIYDSRNQSNAIIHTESNKLIYGAAKTQIPQSVTTIGVNAFRGNKLLTEINIPESVINIDDVAFAGCSALKTINIPKSVTHIGMQAFNGCQNLKRIIVDGKNTVYDSRDCCNAIIKTSNNTLEYGCTTTIIPNSIKYIGGEAFIDCIYLKHIEIPSSVIGIWGSAFQGCENLESVIIGENVTTINDRAFYNCNNLEDITNYSIDPQTIKKTAFSSFNKLHVRKISYSKYKSTDVWSDFSILDDAEVCRIDSVSINAISSTLCVGNKMRINANIYPQNASYKTLKWSTSNPKVATISDGTIYAVGSGTATITARTTDGSNLSTSCIVTVDKKEQTIIWNQSFENIQQGGELVELSAQSSSGLKIKYKSNDDNVAAVYCFDDAYFLNPIVCGITTIVAYQEGNEEFHAAQLTREVTVLEDPDSVGEIKSSEQKIAIYTLSGIHIGSFSKEEYDRLHLNRVLPKGLYVVNGLMTEL